MKNLANLLALVGILLVIYSVLGRFIGNQTIGVGILKVQAQSGLLLANSLMLIALLAKSNGK
ncbi:MAG: hypothetical protein HQ558_04845 [Candidatus Omnitrophica bacterium]|nr:hypothetical protein [Candidatus Omnitrophota bacterium]